MHFAIIILFLLFFVVFSWQMVADYNLISLSLQRNDESDRKNDYAKFGHCMKRKVYYLK